MAVMNEAQLKHGDISRTIFSRCNGAHEYSVNISTAKFFTCTVYCIYIYIYIHIHIYCSGTAKSHMLIAIGIYVRLSSSVWE